MGSSQLDRAKDLVLGLVSTSAILITFQLGLSGYKTGAVKQHPVLIAQVVSTFIPPFVFLLSALVGVTTLFFILEEKSSSKSFISHRISKMVMIQMALFTFGMLGIVIEIILTNLASSSPRDKQCLVMWS